jgi:peptidoglycan-associated lipoprotein
MIGRKKVFILLFVLAAILLCSCAKKKIEQVSGSDYRAPQQNSQSQNNASSPEMLSQPIELPPPQSSSFQDGSTESDAQKGLGAEDIYFNFDEFAISPEGKKILATKAAYLKAHPQLKVMIEGHCDERGTTEYNLALGEKRAGEARNFLIFLGIDANRLSVISYGKEKPASSGHDEDAWAKNRRVHLDAF